MPSSDGALLLASEEAVAKYGLTPLARVLGSATAGVPPRIMGIGPVPAIMKALDQIKYDGWAIAEQGGGETLEGLKNLSERMDKIFAS